MRSNFETTIAPAANRIYVERHAHRRSGRVGDQQTHGTTPDKHKSLEKRPESWRVAPRAPHILCN
jgi:hypothetical protein